MIVCLDKSECSLALFNEKYSTWHLKSLDGSVTFTHGNRTTGGVQHLKKEVTWSMKSIERMTTVHSFLASSEEDKLVEIRVYGPDY